MREKLIVLFSACLVWFLVLCAAMVFVDYHYTNQIAAYWNLSDKASTIQQKAEYLDKFVTALESSRHSEYNAIWLKTPDNKFSENMIALKSLQGRMHAISRMDVNSFAYQQAMAQITEQEQGEAQKMLEVFEGTWYLENHFFLWDWIGICHAVIALVLCVVFGIGAVAFWNDY